MFNDFNFTKTNENAGKTSDVWIQSEFFRRVEGGASACKGVIRSRTKIRKAQQGFRPSSLPSVRFRFKVRKEGGQMHEALRFQIGKLSGQSVMAVNDCPTTLGRLFVTDRTSKI
ncbi:hypothetical protein EVAR_28340_1 [Eumeta japonica]|uniref:Uncharacterized protein n=1 Tax=Eumeta variegata TaxID=151549 RepID=A0A4C1V8E7_EUMVA|nr:hypothetical protein EVAR_28340_1 [Eumeta japonica]